MHQTLVKPLMVKKRSVSGYRNTFRVTLPKPFVDFNQLHDKQEATIFVYKDRIVVCFAPHTERIQSELFGQLDIVTESEKGGVTE